MLAYTFFLMHLSTAIKASFSIRRASFFYWHLLIRFDPRSKLLDFSSTSISVDLLGGFLSIERKDILSKRLSGAGSVGNITKPRVRRRRKVGVVSIATAATSFAAVATHITYVTGCTGWCQWGHTTHIGHRRTCHRRQRIAIAAIVRTQSSMTTCKG
ncbi:hypothetical protein OUZ56_017511 [Daphnia magna]|uniref:Uncharacterized protein n=1 Tax=Daphnia magna TaxID=35525 RepID=A0ABR0ASY0_9CRUS|nr:hypothetical protein OUZ56_017511 [Daphnia magna]